MGHRPHFYVRRIVPVDGGTSPNQYVPQITVEIRVFYPDKQRHRVGRVLTDAVIEAYQHLAEAEALAVGDDEN